MDPEYDVAVVGAGAFGAWTAYRLVQSGRSVILIDQYGPGAPASSSGAESRIIRAGYGANSLYTRFAKESLDAWLEFPEFFRRTGVAWFAPRHSERLTASRHALLQHGVPFEELDSAGIRRLYPQTRFDNDFEAIVEPRSGVLLAASAIQAVVARAVDAGARILSEAIRAPVSDPGRIVTKTGLPISARSFVFCGGAWLPKLFPDVLENIIFATRQPLFFFEVPPGRNDFDPPSLPAWIEDGDPSLPYGCPNIEGHGLKVGFHRLGSPFDPDRDPRQVTDDEIAEARQYVAKRFPGLAAAPLAGYRVCQYENTASGDFIIDRHPSFSNVWFAGGGSGHGFKHGPAVAAYVIGRLDGSTEEQPRFLLANHRQAASRAVI